MDVAVEAVAAEEEAVASACGYTMIRTVRYRALPTGLSGRGWCLSQHARYF
jgi:hypothetical protein